MLCIGGFGGKFENGWFSLMVKTFFCLIPRGLCPEVVHYQWFYIISLYPLDKFFSDASCGTGKTIMAATSRALPRGYSFLRNFYFNIIKSKSLNNRCALLL